MRSVSRSAAWRLFFTSPVEAFHRLPHGRALQRRTAGRHQGLAEFGQRRVRLCDQTGEQQQVTRGIQAPGRAGMTGQFSHQTARAVAAQKLVSER